MSEKKESVRIGEEVIKGAKKEVERRHSGHAHPLMQIKLNLLEISHRNIETIEQGRFKIMNKFDGMESIEEFKDLMFSNITGLSKEDLEKMCE